LLYKLTDALLSSIEHRGEETTLVEELSITFQKLEIDVTSATGSTSVSLP
jgi:type VI protein secretion system component Hcp